MVHGIGIHPQSTQTPSPGKWANNNTTPHAPQVHAVLCHAMPLYASASAPPHMYAPTVIHSARGRKGERVLPRAGRSSPSLS